MNAENPIPVPEGSPEAIKLEDVASTAYESMRHYSKACGDNHHRRWGNLSLEHRQALIEGALFHILNHRNGTMVDAEAAHLHRCKQLFQAGWKFGPLKDIEGKLTPILVGWEYLSPLQRHKYRIFCTVSLNMGIYVEDSELPGFVVMAADTLSQIVGADVALHVGVGGAAPQGEFEASSASSETFDTSSNHQSSDAPEGDGLESPMPPTPSHTSSTDSPSETSESSNSSEMTPPDTEQAGESSSTTESLSGSTQAASE